MITPVDIDSRACAWQVALDVTDHCWEHLLCQQLFFRHGVIFLWGFASHFHAFPKSCQLCLLNASPIPTLLTNILIFSHLPYSVLCLFYASPTSCLKIYSEATLNCLQTTQDNLPEVDTELSHTTWASSLWSGLCYFLCLEGPSHLIFCLKRAWLGVTSSWKPSWNAQIGQRACPLSFYILDFVTWFYLILLSYHLPNLVRVSSLRMSIMFIEQRLLFRENLTYRFLKKG